MSSKPFRRKDIKHDEFITITGQAMQWLMERRRRIGWGLLAVALVVSIVISVGYAQQRQEERAAALLAAAMEVYRAPVVPPLPDAVTPVAAETPSADGASEVPSTDQEIAGATDPASTTDPAAATDPAITTDPATTTDPASATDPASTTDPAAAQTSAEALAEAGAEPPPPPVPPPFVGLQYATETEKYEAARERFLPIVDRYGGRPSGRLAAFYLGICEEELGDMDAAKTAMTQAAEASEPLIAAMARYRLGQLELQVGNAEAAVDHFEQLLERGSALFPREEALLAKARAQEAAGDPRAALATYQLVVNEFPGSYSAVDAQNHVDELSARLGLDPNVDVG